MLAKQHARSSERWGVMCGTVVASRVLMRCDCDLQLYPPPLACEDCAESFVLRAELVRHRKFGCATERTRERLLAAQERAQRRLQAALGKRLREVVRLNPGEKLADGGGAGCEGDEGETYGDEDEGEDFDGDDGVGERKSPDTKRKVK